MFKAIKHIDIKEYDSKMNEINKIGWESYKKRASKRLIKENSNDELVVVKISGSIEDYANNNGFVDAFAAMDSIEKFRGK